MITYTINFIVMILYRGDASDSSILVACTVIFGAMFDAVEGMGLIALVNDPYGFSKILPAMIGICAIMKFTMLLVAIAFIIRPFALENTPVTKRD
jgi:predicted lysophospholipase L1 biosynthesis ABC-type transport system permease subunit